MKKKKTRTLLCGVGALVVLVTALLIVLRLPKTQEEKYEEGNFTILSLKSEKIVEFTIENEKNQQPVTFTYQSDSGWSYTADKDFKMNQNLVKSAMNVLSKLSSSRKLSDIGDRLDKYGLQKPQVRLSLTDSDNNHQVLLLGNPNEVTGGYYMMVEGDDCAYMVDGDFASAFGNDVYNFGLVEEMPGISFSNLTDMRVERKDYNFHMFKDENGNQLNESGYAKWFIDEPLKQLMGCDSNYVKEGLESITGMTFAKMVDYKADKKELQEYGLDNPVIITLKYKEPLNMEETNSELELKYEEKILEVLVGKEYKEDESNGSYYYCKVVHYNGIKREDSGAVGLIDTEAITAAMNLNSLDYVYPQIALPVLDTVDKIEVFKDEKKVIEYEISKTKAISQNKTSQTQKVTKELEALEGNNGTAGNVITANQDEYDFTFHANGVEMGEKDFKEDYQKLVSLRLEKFYLEDKKIDDSKPAYTIVYHRSEGIKTITVKFHPYNNSYYAVEKNGVIQILSNKAAVNDIFENLKALNLK